jgi:hypothetical protein
MFPFFSSSTSVPCDNSQLPARRRQSNISKLLLLNIDDPSSQMAYTTSSPYLGGLGVDLPYFRSGSDLGGPNPSPMGSRSHSPAFHSSHASHEPLLQGDTLDVLGQNVAETNPPLREQINIENPANAVNTSIGIFFT